MGWEQLIAVIITGLYTIIASAGFWQFFANKNTHKDAEMVLLLALTRAVFSQSADRFFEQGWIHRDDYERLLSEVYDPYKTLGGNSSMDRVMEELGRLPLRSSGHFVLKDEFLQKRGE